MKYNLTIKYAGQELEVTDVEIDDEEVKLYGSIIEAAADDFFSNVDLDLVVKDTETGKEL